MRFFLCTTVFSTVLLGAFALPADINSPQAQAQKVVEAEKQPKQNLFGIGIDLNLSKNGTLIPSPAFINTSASYGSGIGAGGNFLVPLVPFPLGLLFPHPPLNITVGFNANKNVSGSLVASTGNVTIEEQEGWGWQPAPPPSGWGWTTTTTPPPSGWGWTSSTPPPSGWGWTTTTTTPPPSGWGWTTTTTTTPPPSGWGWNPPSTTPGWSPPPETTPGWGWVETTTTPGWGWGPVRKGVSPNNPVAASSPNKPQNPGPKPNTFSKPVPAVSQSESAMPAESNAPTYIVDVAESSLSSELPSAEVPAQAEPLPIAEAAAVPALSPPLISQVQDAPAAPQPASLNQDEIPAAEIPSVEIAPPAPAPIPEPAIENMNVKVSVPVSPSSSKSKRHAGVERPSALRIGDFEDVESPNDMNAPPMQEQLEQQEMSKEEMIIMAMEQTNSVLPGAGVQLGNARPAPLRPSLNQLQSMNKPMAEDESDDSANAVDLRNAEAAAAPAAVENSGISKSVSKGKPESEPNNNGDRGGRNKPRPYGMDKPSKNRPTLDSGMKDKAEQFGIPHYNSDLVQKEQYQLGNGGGSSSVLGWQVPDINWSSFSTIFQHFLGSRHKKNSMGKSDAESTDLEKCVDDEEEGVRSQVISSGQLCQTNTGKNSCDQACVQSGFASGNCLGPYPTPGCLCRMPNHKEYGMMLSPLKKAEENREELLSSDVAPCKKCACAQSCKATGSYTGFCIDKCYCAVPWYTKEV